MTDRRQFILLLLMGLAAQGSTAACAKDGDGGGDGGDGGGDGDGGSGKSGSGKSDSGKSESGKDSDGSNDRDDDDRDKDSDKKKEKEDDDDRIRSAVKAGRAEPLRNILSNVRRRYKGQVVRIRLTGTGANLQYRIRLIDQGDKLIEVRVHARTAQILGAAGL